MQLEGQIASIESATTAEKLSLLGSLVPAVLSALGEGSLANGTLERLRAAALEVVESSMGSGQERLPIGELLGYLGDPRLSAPSSADYWVSLELESGDILKIGRYPVTNGEFQTFVSNGGYDDRSFWSDEGWAWLEGCDNPWPLLSKTEGTEAYTVPNQPVVGVTYYEAEAFAAAHAARLPRWYERVFVVRGVDKRKYPWGSPFGEGNANSKEEVLQRPCAVGLYRRDVTPDGVYDLAANAGEWSADAAGEEQLLHPGSWEQPSLAAWAKALTTQARTARSGALGFRVATDG